MSRLVKIQGFGKVTDKGNQTIICKMSKGFSLSNQLYYIASTPELIKEFNLSEGADISKQTTSHVVETSNIVDDNTGEELTFKWLVPA